MTITVIRRSDICRDVPARWAERYKDDPAFIVKTAKLQSLSLEELTVSRIDAIIGNETWTRNTCDECGEDREVTVRIGDVAHYGSRWLDLCAGCLRKAAYMLDND
jgi:hypothetical protein